MGVAYRLRPPLHREIPHMNIYRRVTLVLLTCLGLCLPQARAAQAALFDRLTGTWDVVYDIYDKDGKLSQYHGQVSYSRILDGTTLQEVWTSDAHNKVPQPYSTTIAFQDSQQQHWTEVWIYPARGVVGKVSGGEVDGRLVLNGRDDDGTLQRWTVSDVKADSIEWRFESSTDQGKTWRLLGVNHLRQHAG